MENDVLNKLVIGLNEKRSIKNVETFLMCQELKLDKGLEYITAIEADDKLVAVGGFEGSVLKCIAVDDEHKGMGLSNKIVSELVSEEYSRGNSDLFIFTKPKNYKLFSSMGFYKIEEANNSVVLLENNRSVLKKYIETLKSTKIDGKIISSIVVNCNPFTLGHKYLIEKASKESDVLHVFVVSEDKSVFPADIRFKLVKEGTQHLKNVVLHKTGNYVISNATFPTYFIKKEDEAVKSQTILDIKIFGRYIVRSLGINRRYVGEEKNDEVTKIYNDTMKELLPSFGVEVIEVPRLKVDNEIVSASKVRTLIKLGKIPTLKKLLPEVTYKFITSEAANKIIKNIN
jgi:[citrate (pro-3S)-lyase] ligase